jgi:ABC-type uncharacterized transport system involved in gliding motility auxiliary subunit
MDKKKQEIMLFILVLGVIVFAAFNSMRFFFRIDMTRNKAFTISEVSKSLFKEIPEKVHITYFLSDKLNKVAPEPGQITDLLHEYAAFSRGKIEVAVVDPAAANLTGQAENMGVVPRPMRVVEKNEVTRQSISYRKSAWIASPDKSGSQ